MTAATPAQQLVGAVLSGRFHLNRILGEGGMGAVYEADTLTGEGKRAIKLLHQEFVREDQILQRFFAEAVASHSIRHPNVVHVFETGTAENGTPFLVMELLVGTPLSMSVNQHQVLPPQIASQVVLGVLAALTAAHSRGIVHRDIKPDNIFLAHDASGVFTPKVLDFGIAKVMDVAGGMGQRTRTGVLLGTPGYMAPEQIKNAKAVDPRCDLWSVAVIFYELLTGQEPFPGENEFARLTQVLSEDERPIDEVAPHLAMYRSFFQKALAKDPALRFQSANDMAQAVTNVGAAPVVVRPAASTVLLTPLAGEPANAASYSATVLVSQFPGSPTAMVPAPPEQTLFIPAANPPVAPLVATAPSLPFAPVLATSPSPPVVRPSQEPPPPPAGTPLPRPSYAPPPMHLSPTVSSFPPPSPASFYSHAGAPLAPTHVSAQHPGIPAARGPLPSVEILDPRTSGAAWWIVAVIGIIAFGLGLTLGLLIGPI